MISMAASRFLMPFILILCATYVGMYFHRIYFWFKISWAKNSCIKPRSKGTFLCNFQCETVTNKHSCQMYRTAFFLHAMAPSYGSN